MFISLYVVSISKPVVFVIGVSVFVVVCYVYQYKQTMNSFQNTLSPTVDFRNFIVFCWGRGPGTLKSDIVSKKNIHN